MKQRVNFIDLLRGFAIFLIVFYHMIGYSKNLGDITIYLSSFHVALFFLISGFTYNIKDISFKEYFKRKFKRIMIPYFIFALLFIIPYYLFQNITSSISDSEFGLGHFLFGIIYGSGAEGLLKQNTPLWFLPCLFITEVLAYFIFKLKNISSKKYLLISLLIIIGFLSYKFIPIILPYSLNTALTMMTFFTTGYFIKNSKILNINRKNKIIISISLIILGIVFASFNIKISYMLNNYGNYFIFLLSSIFSCFGYLLLFSLFDTNDKFLLTIGKSTMGILIFHKLLVVLCQTGIPILINGNIIIQLVLAIFLSVITVYICTFIELVINKFFPYLYGKVN